MKKFLINFLWILIIIVPIILAFIMLYDSAIRLQIIKEPKLKNNLIENTLSENTDKNQKDIINEDISSIVVLDEDEKQKEKIDDWRLVLVNYENTLPEDFVVNLSNIDKTRQFDSRAIEFLNEMLKALKKDGIKSVWVQSAYRSPEYQRELYNEKVEEVMSYNVSKEEAEDYTSRLINKPGTSEHNLGLAVDFNYVDEDFDKTEGFEWLMKNAENFGFILRYKKEKQDITKVSYEPWHWRFVGQEHAKKMNELDMCLEEYVEYLENN